MRRLSTSLAIGIAALCGCAAFVALLPWGDPCSLIPPSDRIGCPVVLVPLQENLRNLSFGGICLIIGFIGGLLTSSHRLVVGALSPPLAYLLGLFAAHWIYHIGSPEYSFPRSFFTIYMTLGLSVGIAVLGLVGARLSRHVRLTTASSARA